MICVYPDFYRAFACKASFCRHSCCRGWEIDVDEESAAYYCALPGKLGDDLRAGVLAARAAHLPSCASRAKMLY